MEELLNGIKGLEQIDKTQFPEQAEPTVHEKLSRAGIEDNYSYENREIFQEGREKTDLINKPESVVAEGKTKISREETPEFKKANEWAETYLSNKVVDKYALSYVKNKKSPEEKRKNKKYDRWLGIANNELKPKLVELLEQKIKNKAIDKKESDSNKIKNEIAKILNSEMHATLLLRVLSDFTAEELAKKERVETDFGEKASFLVKDERIPGEEIRKNVIDRSFPTKAPENSGITKISEVSREDEDQLAREMKKGYPEIIGLSQESEPLSEVDAELVTEPEHEGETEEEKLKDEAVESSKTETEFFKKYKKDIAYVSSLDGSEVKILSYDSEKGKVSISVYQPHIYDEETGSHQFIDDKNKVQKREVALEELESLLENSFVDGEIKKEKEKEVEEKIENDMEKLNELEKKLVDIFRGEVLEYEKKAEQWVREIFSEELWDINKKDLIIKWIDKTLSGLIKEALENNNIKDASVEKVVNNLKSEITPIDELAEKIKNDIKSLLEKF